MNKSVQTRSPLKLGGLAVGAALVALLAAGCHDDTPPTPTVVTTPGPSTTTVVPAGGTATPSVAVTPPGPDTKINTNAGPGGSTGTDTVLADKINTAIVHNKQMTGSRVEVLATAGVVTLNGTVQNQQQKGLAQTTAQNTPGVGTIKNKLLIVTTGGAKSKPTVITKTKTVVVHDQAPAPAAAPDTTPAAPSDASGTDASTPPSAPPPATSGTTGQ